MEINLVESKSSEGVVEFFFVGLESIDDFDLILEALTRKPEVKLIENLTGIFFCIGTLEADGTKFKLVFHEDVGNYAFVIDETSEGVDTLRRILKEVIGELKTQKSG